MRYKLLGRSGLRVSELALGTMTFGTELGWGADKDESKRIFDTFVEAGGNLIDTANEIYTGGTSEKFVGEFIGANRDYIVLGTKYTDAAPGTDPNRAGNQRKNMVQSLERSLKRLGTDYVDLYWLHAWDFMTPVEEVMRALDDLVRAGKVLYVGLSDAPAWVIAQANTHAAAHGLSPFIATQAEYSLVEHTADREIVPMAKALDIGVLGWSPLASGLLTGKYAANVGTSTANGGGKRLDAAPFVPRSERNMAIADQVALIAGEVGATPSQVALAWVRSRGVIPLVGATKVDQLVDNLGSLQVRLSDEQLGSLDSVGAVELGFPHDFLAKTRGYTYGGTHDLIDSQRR
jgi:aryl-alcohol dehydrogenase-like predicted oxidoreductase